MKGKWKSEMLKDIGEIVSGGTPSSTIVKYWGGDILWITPTDLSKLKFSKISTSIRKITKQGLANSSANIIPKESVVLSSRAPIGYLAIPTDNYTTNQGCKSIVIKDDCIAEYIYYFFSLNKSRFTSRGEGTTFAEISKKQVEIVKIDYPPIPQQKKIAKILSTCDAVIEQTEAAIAKYEAIKKGMMHDLFTRGIDVETGKLRARYEDAPELYKESELGMVPREWEVRKLEEICIGSGKYGVNAAAVEYHPKLPRYIRITDITLDGKYNNKGRVSVDHPDSQSYVLKKGDIVFARTGASTGKTYLYNNNDGHLVYAGFLIKFSIDKNKAIFKFIKDYTEIDFFNNWVITYSARTGQPGINGNEYGMLPITIPSIKEQRLISEKTNSLNEKIDREKDLTKKYKTLKQGLMQDLLTGRVEVEA